MKKTETGFLMCPPDHYEIRYVINPWMKLSRQSDPEKTNVQWKRLFDILSSLNCRIDLVKPAPELPDMVFTANAGLPVGKKVFLSRFRHEEREPEATHFREWFERNDFEVIEFPPDVFFEGSGDALRSDIRAHTFISETLGIQVLSLELVEKHFYHLDTCFAPLSTESVLYYPPAFDRYGQKVIEENIPDPVPVPEKEARRFVCNAVVTGKDVVIHEHCPETGLLLADRGFRVHEINLSEFIKAGGSAKCLTLEI
jgi:N-dimethylarginine dimethylaminohydrolase